MDTAPLSLYYCPLAPVDTELQREYRAVLGAEECARADELRVDAVRAAYLASRALLRTALAQALNCSAQELRFMRDHNNKPQLAFPDAGWHFNLSHSGDWVALALSGRGPVGVDVECHVRHNKLEAISRRFFSANEHQALMALPELERRQRFFELWTLKESYVKAIGRGIATAMAGTDIQYLEPARFALHLQGAALCPHPVHCWHYALAPDYSLAATLIAHQADAIGTPALYHCLPLRHCDRNTALQPLRLGRARP